MEYLFRTILSLLAKTWRFQVKGNLPKNNAIVGFWHGFMLPGWYILKHLDVVGVVSQSKDGQILSNLLEKWDYKLIRGSSSKGGKEVLNEIYSLNDEIVVMTPDGPRGPRFELKPGLVVSAKKTQKDLYFLKINIKSYKEFPRAWDKFKLPLPFSKIEIDVIGPIKIQAELSREEIDEKIKELNEVFI